MKKLIAVAALSILLAGCGVNHTQAITTLEAMGLTNIKMGGYAWLGCGEDDTMRSSFTAIGANGKPVSGVVCGGWFKGYTVRFM